MRRYSSPSRRFWKAVWGLSALIAVGCAPRAIRPVGRPHHVVVLPGILGHTPWLDRIREAVVEEMPDASAQVWDWTRIDPHWLPNPVGHIRDYGKNRVRARLLAEQIARVRRDHPDVRISIVALSGGAAIALFACEELSAPRSPPSPAGSPAAPIDRIVLLSPGMSPGYDLTPALARSENGILNYWSPRDWLVLKRGTSRFGTGDRRYEPSAGYSGFDEQLICGGRCEGLTQIGWHDGLRRLDNRGGHGGSLAPEFLRKCVVPWLQGDTTACAAPDQP